MQTSLCMGRGLPWHYLPDITSSAQAQNGIPVTSFHGQDSHFHYGGASRAAQPFSPLFLSSSPLHHYVNHHNAVTLDLSKIQTHLKDRSRLLTQTLLSWSCTSISLLSASWQFPVFFPFPDFSFLFLFTDLICNTVFPHIRWSLYMRNRIHMARELRSANNSLMWKGCN